MPGLIQAILAGIAAAAICIAITMVIQIALIGSSNNAEQKVRIDTPIPMEDGLYSLHKYHTDMLVWLEQHPEWIVVSASQGDGYGMITYTIRKKEELIP